MSKNEVLEKYCKRTIPDESTLRKTTVHKCYTETVARIQTRLQNNFIYFIVDETTDVCGRYIANLLVGTLSANFVSDSYLIAVKELEKANNVTISRFVQECLTNTFLPNPIPCNYFGVHLGIMKLLIFFFSSSKFVVKFETVLIRPRQVRTCSNMASPSSSAQISRYPIRSCTSG